VASAANEEFLIEIRKLKTELERIERELLGAGVPFLVLDDLKRSVDHLRITLWAMISSGPGANPEEMTAAVVRLRLKRTADMCKQIMLDIDGQQLGVDTPELGPVRTSLLGTLERIDRLFQSGV